MRNNARKKFTAACILAAALATAPAARASLLAYDNFSGDTSGGNLTSDTAGASTGSDPFSGGWTYPSGGNTIYTESQSINSPGSPEPSTSVVAQTSSGFSDAQRYLTSPLPTSSGTTLFASYLINGSAVDGTDDADLLSLSGSSANSFVVEIGTGHGSGSDSWGFTVANTATGTASSFQPVSNVTIAAGTTYLLVVELSYSGNGTTDSVTMWVDPTSSNPSSAAGSVTLAGTATNSVTLAAVDSVQLFENYDGNAVDFGNVALGTTFADVVPEPSAAIALCMATAGMLMRRARPMRHRRRRA